MLFDIDLKPSCFAYPYVWMRQQVVKKDDDKFYIYLLFNVDDILVCSEHLHLILEIVD